MVQQALSDLYLTCNFLRFTYNLRANFVKIYDKEVKYL